MGVSRNLTGPKGEGLCVVHANSRIAPRFLSVPWSWELDSLEVTPWATQEIDLGQRVVM